VQLSDRDTISRPPVMECIICIIITALIINNVEPKDVERYKGPHGKIWTDSQCTRLGWHSSNDLMDCMDKCSQHPDCYAFNYRDGKDCFLRNCPLPIPEPSLELDGYNGYSLNPGVGECPGYFTKIAEQCLFFNIAEKLNKTDAEITCNKTMNGTLAYINNPEALVDLITNHYAALYPRFSAFWVGGSNNITYEEGTCVMANNVGYKNFTCEDNLWFVCEPITGPLSFWVIASIAPGVALVSTSAVLAFVYFRKKWKQTYVDDEIELVDIDTDESSGGDEDV
ncbi:unnamed protein product, partial [Meganyctiphanes norvegica]